MFVEFSLSIKCQRQTRGARGSPASPAGASARAFFRAPRVRSLARILARPLCPWMNVRRFREAKNGKEFVKKRGRARRGPGGPRGTGHRRGSNSRVHTCAPSNGNVRLKRKKKDSRETKINDRARYQTHWNYSADLHDTLRCSNVKNRFEKRNT